MAIRGERVAPKEFTETDITRGLRNMQKRLFTALKAEYPERTPDRNWTVCGPAALAVPPALEKRAGISLTPESKLILSVYDPPGHLEERAEQVSLLIPLSNGRILFVDPTYEFCYKKKTQEEGEMVIKSYKPQELKENLRKEFHLVPFFVPPPGEFGKIGLFGRVGEEVTLPTYFDFLLALNDGSAYQNQFAGRYTGIQRDVRTFWGDRVLRVINATV